MSSNIRSRETVESSQRTRQESEQTEHLAKIGYWERDLVEEKCTYCSPELARFHGVSVDEYLQQVNSLSADLTSVHPDDREHYERWCRLKAKSESVVVYRILQPEGAVRHVREVELVILAEDGSRFRSVGFVQDITDQVLAENALAHAHEQLEQTVAERTAELRQRESQFKQALSIAKLGHWYWDPAIDQMTFSPELGKILQIAPGDGLLYSNLDFVTKFVHPDDRKRVFEFTEMSGDPGLGFFKIEYRIVRENGEIRWVRDVGEILVDEEGVYLGEAGVLQDVTEQRQAEARLRQVQKMEAVGQLTGGVAHDFNNLLAAILGNLELAIDATRSGEDAEELLAEALQATFRGADLTKQLLAFSGKGASTAGVGDVNQVLREMTGLFQRTLGEETEIDISLWPSECGSEFDPAQLESALLNLAINARDAMTGGGTLTIETELVEPPELTGSAEGERSVRISVVDSGVGMAPAVRERALEPFYTTKEEGKGSGLGLSMVYGFVERCGGQLELESEPGRGTAVHILLPFRELDGAATLPAGKQEVPRAKNGEVVLIVEDKSDVRRITVRILQSLGYELLEAESGVEAIKQIDSHRRIDLVLSDIVMPGALDGVQIISIARSKIRNVKVLLMSGFPRLETDDSGAGHILTPVLRKPFRKAELARAVRSSLDSNPGESDC